MAAPPFVHLHLHSEYSLLDGACRVGPLAARAKELGMDAVAITDHGYLHGIVPFYQACREHEVKPIIGCECYVAPRSRFDRRGKADGELGHLVLLAEDEQGYRNLIALVTAANLEGFYYRPRVDRELLARHHQGLIALSACLKGEIADLAVQDREQQARDLAAEYRDLFGPDHFYLELQNHGIPEQEKANARLVEIGRELGIPLVATNDVHYLRREDAEGHDVLLCIQTGKTVDDPKRLRFQGDHFYLKSAEEMAEALPDHPEALARTVEIAERCQVEIPLGDVRLPAYSVPEGETLDSYLRRLCDERLPARYPDAETQARARERLDQEMDVISQKGLAGLILISWDAIDFARKNGILVGPGRGSAVGMLTLYLLHVTNVDPLAHGLPFERWANPERISMPDIDSDFEDSRRDEVIRHVTERFGADRVAQIVTFGTMGARLAVRDVGRALQVPLAEVDRIAKMIDQTQTIEEALETVEDLRRECERDPTVKRMVETARLVEGLPRHASTHAGGLVIADRPLTEIVPLQRSTEGEGTTTQFDMDAVTAVGLLKLDVLGLRTLTVLKRAVELIGRTRGIEVDLDAVPFDDRETYDLLARGETAGVFQLESAGMRRVLVDLQPDRFEDIIAAVALFRPGPMARIPDYVAGKHGKRKISYLHPRLEPILRDTYGIIVYQEQVMQIAKEMAGFSPGAADTLLRAMGKKKAEVMRRMRAEFVRNAEIRGVKSEVATKVSDEMREFARYGFNKAHSACYALNAYQTAYLKAHYPAEFMAAQLTSVIDNKDKVAAYIEECRRMGITVRPPDVNDSEEDFTVIDGEIRFGLGAVKHVGHGPVAAILAARGEGERFRDVYDLCSRIDPGLVNRAVIESLGKAGALASLGGSRKQIVEAVKDAFEVGQRAHRDRLAGQTTLFGDAADTELLRDRPRLPDVGEYSREELLALEKEYLGVFASEHPLDGVAERLSAHATATIGQLLEGGVEEEWLVVGGLVTGFRRYVAKNGRPMAFLTLEDRTGTAEVTVFPDVFERDGSVLTPDAVVLVRGKAEGTFRGDEGRGGAGRAKLLASAVASLDEPERVTKRPPRQRNANSQSRPRGGGRAQAARAPASLHVRILETLADRETLSRLRRVLGSHPGELPVMLHLKGAAGETMLSLSGEFKVKKGPELNQALEALVGEGAVWTD